MIQVVLDTNVLISALLHPEGLPAKVLLVATGGSGTRLCVSGEVYSEYEEVIRRPRFKRSENEITDTLRSEPSGTRALGSNPPLKCEPALTRMTIFFWNARRQPVLTILDRQCETFSR